jgi:DNA-binding transcriptional LysR family regulator
LLSVPRLKILIEVAESGSFSAAADSLSYTQSAVSQAIATLEAEAGTELLERDRRGARPTPAGAALIAHAGAIIARLDTAEDEVRAIAGGRRGKLRLASFPTAGATLIPLAVSTFAEANPDVELSLAESEPEEIAPRLRAHEFDLALLFEFHGVGHRFVSGAQRVELLEDPMRLALPEGHPLAERRRLRLEDLRDESWVQSSEASPCARHVVRSCIAAGFEPRVSFESDDYQTVQGLVAAGVGVALIPELALTTVRSDIVVRSLGRKSPVRTVIAGTPGGRMEPPVAAMLDALQMVSRAYRFSGRAPDPNATPDANAG